jgi:APA family basic amino acid/polyamine antiporter
LTNIGTLAAFILVSIGVVILRTHAPDLQRSFRVPGVPWVPIISVIGCLVLVSQLPILTIVRFIVWLVLGLVVYYFYARKHSALAEPDALGEA